MPRLLPLALSVLLSAASLFAANWTSGGPHGGVMLSISASASNPRVVYAGGYGGIFRSDDNGETWRSVSSQLTSVTQLAADPSDPERAYAIVNSVYRTTDGGATWMPMNTGLALPNRILIDSAVPKTLYISGDCGAVFKTGSRHIGIAKSTDGGDTWQDATEGFPESGFEGCVGSIALDPANPRHLYAKPGLGGPSWESFDGAATWSKTTATVPGVAIVANPKSSRRFGTDAKNVLASNDGGVTWSVQLGEGLPDGGSGVHVIDMTLDPSVPRLFSATSYGLFRSGDGGRSWLPVGDGPAVSVSSVVFNAVESTVMMATSQGLFRAPSPAFTPWKHLDVPESGIDMISDIAVDPRRPSVVFAASRDNLQGRIFRSRDAGASWQQMTGPMPSSGLKVSVDASGDAWFGGNAVTSTLYRIPSGTNDVVSIKEFGRIYAIAGSPTVPARVYVSNGLVWRTDDAGATWIKCSDALAVTELALNPSDPNLVYATGSFNSLWRSTDGCATFQPLVADPANNHILHVASAPSNPSVFYRASNTAPSTFRSDDGGATWTLLPSQTALDPTKIVVDPHDPYSVWMSFLNTGIRHSANGGATWKDVSVGLPEAFHRAAFAMALDPTGSVLHAGLFRSGVWELRIPPPRRRAAGPGR
jgi:photosystem II stability/assembly factor-like uncharacterized protein